MFDFDDLPEPEVKSGIPQPTIDVEEHEPVPLAMGIPPESDMFDFDDLPEPEVKSEIPLPTIDCDDPESIINAAIAHDNSAVDRERFMAAFERALEEQVSVTHI